MIHPRMYEKAMQLIAEDSAAAWRRANIDRNGRQRKTHRPYQIPQRTHDLVAALGRNDAQTVASLFHNEYLHKLTDYDF